MDANGQRFWMLSDRADWRLREAVGLDFDDPSHRLRLRSEARNLPAVAPLGDEAAVARVPMARDVFGTRAFWNPAGRTIHADGAFDGVQPLPGVGAAALPGSIPITRPFPAGLTPTDLAMGVDGVLYAAVEDRRGAAPVSEVWLIDRRDRWPEPVRVSRAGFDAWRLAANPAGGAWVLDRSARQLGVLQGLPFATHLEAEPAATVFRPEPENPNPPRIELADPPEWLADESPVALAADLEGRLAVLSWHAGGEALVRLRGLDGGWESARRLRAAGQPFSLAWLAADRLAFLVSVPGGVANEAFVFPLGVAGDDLQPLGEFHPLRGHDGGPFAHGLALPPHYAVEDGHRSRPLLSVSLPSLALEGHTAELLLDSGEARTDWHRLYVEALVPAHCGMVIELAAAEDRRQPVEAWHAHLLGETEAPEANPVAGPDPEGWFHRPRAIWQREASELPHHPGLLDCPREPGRAGLFTALIQSAGSRVRTLRGRYLHLRLTLSGTGRATPEVAALRAYGSRFSYRDRYLPELYRETLFGADAAATGPATRSDFLERFLGNFEGILTSLEDRIANAHVLMDPRSAPDEALEWLGSWIGVVFDPAFPAANRRNWVAAAHRLFQRRGTLPGLQLALEIATGGGLGREVVDGREVETVSGGHLTGGEIVVVEDFRMRRTLATILGADLQLRDDALVPGLSVSGNSFIGDTLFLGESGRREFLALFRHAFSGVDSERVGEEAAVEDFFERFANRVTVLVHQEIEPQDLGLIRRVVAQEAPAHVDVRTEKASQALVVGLASLLDVDSYLGPLRPRTPARLNRSSLGAGDFILQTASLDPRLEGGRRLPPAP